MAEREGGVWVVGSRVESTALKLSYPQVSGRHFQFVFSGSAWCVEDLNSTNGTSVDGRRLEPGQPAPLSAGSTLGLGISLSAVVDEELITALDSADEQRIGAWLKAAISDLSGDRGSARAKHQTQSLQLGREAASSADEPSLGAASLSLGHAPTCDIVIAASSVGKRHARLWFDGHNLTLQDLGGSEGTWVRGEKIDSAKVQVGDEISLGAHRLEVEAAWLDKLKARHAAVSTGSFDAVEDVIIVGRDPNADVTLDVPVVSGRHLELVPRGDRLWKLRDLSSTNGTSVHNLRHRVSVAIVTEDDAVFLGSYRVVVSDLLARARERRDSTGSFDPAHLSSGLIIVGRDPACAITLDDPSVSREHLRARRIDDATWQLEDPGSVNGTFVNGERLRGKQTVSVGARVQIGRFSLRIDPQEGLVVRDFRGDLSLQADRISVEVPDKASPGGSKRILHDISFTAYPTEFVGLMGPSGAGKTTLLTALNGYLPPSQGRSLVNGQNLVEHYDLFRSRIGYVPQDDIVYPQLTVYESLYFTAKLRLPPDTSEEEIEERIQAILDRLEIQQTRDTRIGDATRRGISGGQRKRVNLAQELLTEPSLLLLDEPTSGLAAEDTINVMKLLRSLADQGKTVLLTIHQPSLEAYRLMDNVLFLLQGRLVYYGPAWPESILFFQPDARPGHERDALLADPGNALRPLAIDQRQALETQGDAERDAALKTAVQRRRQNYIDSEMYRQFVWDRASAAAPGNEGDSEHASSRQKSKRVSLWNQLRVLTQRAARIKVKDTLSVAILLAQAPIIALILALVFAGGRSGEPFFDHLARGPAALFLLIASAVWFGCSNSAREIVGEAAIYRRERMVNLRIPAYVGSKFLVLGALCAVQCLLLLGIVYFPLGLDANFFLLYLLLFLTSLVGLGMGLTLSAFVSTPESAVGLVPLLLIPQIILGGVIMPVHELPTAMKTLSMTMVARWGFEGALHLEYGDTDADAVRSECGIPDCLWGIGPTGQGYWPSDPARVQEAIEQSGMRAVDGRVVMPVEPSTDHELCRAYCTSLQYSWPVTPMERSFGVSRSDPARALAHTRIVDEGRSQASWRAPARSSRTAQSQIWLILFGLNIFLFGLVCAAMKARDVDVGG